MKKIKFYWNKNYPETVYVMGLDVLNGDKVLYVLTDATEDEPFTGEETKSGNLSWHRCSWSTNKSAMTKNGFELIGEL